ncbi:hypothetical protein [Desulfatirhabdium butyrativorans]|uniref:hypothetical protein n=1 Tax=Desulfatirhabdium butyrativorans TaxID=340467 RepID=UPI001B7FB4A9|nr:hypothetical protein [Desulfatirhabdium butyrativorans]
MRNYPRTAIYFEIFRGNTETDDQAGAVMNIKEELMSEIEESPELLLSEVLDFVHFLKARTLRKKMDTATMSESSLGKDWLNSEENEAWQGL